MKKKNSLNIDDAIESGISEFGRLWQGNSSKNELEAEVISQSKQNKTKSVIKIFAKVFNFIKIQ